MTMLQVCFKGGMVVLARPLQACYNVTVVSGRFYKQGTPAFQGSYIVLGDIVNDIKM